MWTLEYGKREVCGSREEAETEHEDGAAAWPRAAVRWHEDPGVIGLDDLATGIRASHGRLTARLEDGRTALASRR